MKKNINNKILIYANSSLDMGGGHIMRQLALAQTAKRNNWQVDFIYHHCCLALITRLHNEGFESYCMLHSSFVEQVTKFSANAIVVDDYFLTDKNKQDLRKLTIPIITFDDQTDELPVVADIIINSADNAVSDDYSTRAEKAQLCLGVDFRVIRDQFLLQRTIPTDNNNRNRILITLGDSDVKNLTIPIATNLLLLDSSLPLDIVIGSMTEINERDLLQLDTHYPNVVIHRNISDMSTLMSEAGMAITTAGGTLYELALLGVPMAALCIVENQVSALHSSINNQGYIGYDLRDYPKKSQLDSLLQEKNTATLAKICLNCIDLWQLPERRLDMSKQLQQYIDGLGSQRIIDVLNRYISDNN